MSGLKSAVKAVVPNSLLVARRKMLLRRTERRFRDASNAEIFSTVYERQHWGLQGGDKTFDSGDGSRDPAVVAPYVEAVHGFLTSLPAKPDVVDLGCGDFNVGRQVRPFCAGYVAGDVVPALIERNRALPDAADVDFRCLDIARDPLPEGDVVTIRQVLQHLSNADVAQVVAKLAQYQYAIITDHQPAGSFTPNVDIPSGPHIRVGIDSALDLAKEPFRLSFVEMRELCLVPSSEGGVIRTTLYRLR
jgi:SAM-dependent methyltransferase